MGTGYVRKIIGAATASSRGERPIASPSGTASNVPSSSAATARHVLTAASPSRSDVSVRANSANAAPGSGRAGDAIAIASSCHPSRSTSEAPT